MIHEKLRYRNHTRHRNHKLRTPPVRYQIDKLLTNNHIKLQLLTNNNNSGWILPSMDITELLPILIGGSESASPHLWRSMSSSHWIRDSTVCCTTPAMKLEPFRIIYGKQLLFASSNWWRNNRTETCNMTWNRTLLLGERSEQPVKKTLSCQPKSEDSKQWSTHLLPRSFAPPRKLHWIVTLT